MTLTKGGTKHHRPTTTSFVVGSTSDLRITSTGSDRVDAVVVTRTSDRWLNRLVAALAEVVSRRPIIVNGLADAEVAIAARAPEVVVFDPSVTGTDFPLILADRSGSRCIGWLGSR